MPPGKQKILKNLLESFDQQLTREEFDATINEIIKIITEGNNKILEIVATRQLEKDKEMEKCIADLKIAGDMVIQELKSVGDTTFSAMRTRTKEAMDNLFARMDMQGKFDSLVSNYEKKVEELDTKINEVPVIDTKKIAKEAVTLVQPTDIRDKLEEIKTEDEKLSIEAIKDLRKELDELKKAGGGRTTVIATTRGAVKLYDLSDQLNGVLKTFSLPAFWRVIDVKSASFPHAFRPTTDYTTDGSAMTITFTSQIDATTTLATGQTLLVEYAEL